jgi:hypothetical protein
VFVVDDTFSYFLFARFTIQKPEVVARSPKVTVTPPLVEKKEETKKEDAPVVPSAWGSRPSFADVLKKEETTSS